MLQVNVFEDVGAMFLCCPVVPVDFPCLQCSKYMQIILVSQTC